MPGIRPRLNAFALAVAAAFAVLTVVEGRVVPVGSGHESAVVILAAPQRPDELPRSFSPERAARSMPVAPPTTIDRDPGWQERMGAAALASLAYPWERLGYGVHFLPARTGYLGLTLPGRRLIEMYVRPNTTVPELARNVAHELGHALDREHSSSATRATYKAIRGIGAVRGWYPCNACTDLATPAGDFAEAFSFWLDHGAFPSRSRLAPAPDAAQLQQLIPLFQPPDVHSNS